MNYDKYTDEELRDILKYMIMQLSDEECGKLLGSGLPQGKAPRNDAIPQSRQSRASSLYTREPMRIATGCGLAMTGK